MKIALLSEINKGNVKLSAVVSEDGELLEFIDDVNHPDDTGNGKLRKKIPDRKTVDKSGDFAKVYQDFALMCATEVKGSIIQKVLWVLVAKVRYGNKLTIKIKEIGEVLGVAASHITTAMKTLQKLGVVYPIKRGEWDIPWRNFFKGDPISLKLAQMRETDRLNATVKPKEFTNPVREKKCVHQPQPVVYSVPDFDEDLESYKNFTNEQGDYHESQGSGFFDEVELSCAY